MSKQSLLTLIEVKEALGLTPISDIVVLKIQEGLSLSSEEQEELFTLRPLADLNMADRIEELGLGPRDQWVRVVFGPAWDYAQKAGLLDVPFARITRETEELFARAKPERAIRSKNFSFGFHVTEGRNIRSIQRRGLVPRDPSLETGLEDDRTVFFFGGDDESSFQDAIEFAENLLDDESPTMGIFRVDLRGLPLFRRGSLAKGGTEVFTNQRVLPERLQLVQVVEG